MRVQLCQVAGLQQYANITNARIQFDARTYHTRVLKTSASSVVTRLGQKYSLAFKNNFSQTRKTDEMAKCLSNMENPAISDIIDNHIKLKEQEATDALIQPLQATPIFKSDVDKILDQLITLSNDAKNL
ncbi:hypothetical protein BDR26DRAFT_899781 [Obelidium mucronatum]|nr:hypothetical protein BDR26DRAFT_899781 [Obelidium mucronatum]